jgi:hypothetical protein
VEIDLSPKLLEGTIDEIHDVGVKIRLKGRMGVLTLPLRAVFTDKKLEVGNTVELYLSYARVIPGGE